MLFDIMYVIKLKTTIERKGKYNGKKNAIKKSKSIKSFIKR